MISCWVVKSSTTPITIMFGDRVYILKINKISKYLKKNKSEFALFQCTSKYPTNLREVGLNVIDEMKVKYKVPVGLSDHTGLTSSSFAAIVHGANIIEFHVVFDKKMFGPDTQSSVNFEQLNQIVKFRNDYFVLKNHQKPCIKRQQ